MVCWYGILILTILGFAHASDLVFSTDGCYFGGAAYDDRSTLPFSCFKLTCINQMWVFGGIDMENCDVCNFNNDPHIVTFDKSYYDWMGVCNYSLSQPSICDNDQSYNPDYAVYGDFRDCSFGTVAVSCVDCTTYKIDSNTVVTIDHFNLDKLVVNGKSNLSPTPSTSLPLTPKAVWDAVPNYYPAIVWKQYSCIYLVGYDFSIEACPEQLYIYTSKSHQQSLVGLCGWYTGSTSDDYVPRGSCHVPVTLAPFALSWLTQVQKPDCIITDEPNRNHAAIEIVQSCDLERYRPICEPEVKAGYGTCDGYGITFDSNIEYSIDICAIDCCFFPDHCDEWAKINVTQMAKIDCANELMKNGIFIKPPEA